jgi:hypothetical protein
MFHGETIQQLAEVDRMREPIEMFTQSLMSVDGLNFVHNVQIAPYGGCEGYLAQ